MTDTVDCVVIGAGVVGLAVARALARSGREAIILERETVIGSGISSRNSEVIHAGIYYPKASLKARLCVLGRRQLYDYCAARHIPHRKCGKLIVATSPEQISELEAIKAAGEANGVDDLTWLDPAEVARLEPAVSCVRALLSPSTGIIDSHAYMLSLLADAEAAGAIIAYATAVTRMAVESHQVAIFTDGDTAPSLHAKLVINAAGLHALDVARAITGFPAGHIPRGWLAKGNYFTLSGRTPFKRLIYPVPEKGGLGVHVTLDTGGRARFGPDVEWTDRLDYSVDPSCVDRFIEAVRCYWPDLPDDALQPGYAGIRPKLSGPGQPPADFHIGGASSHGMTCIINLFGIESPGLTASLAIGDEVLQLANAQRAS